MATLGSLATAFGRSPRTRRAAVFLAALGLAGCAASVSDLGYYWQSTRGHLALMAAARPIPELLADPTLDPRLKSRLEVAAEVRAFASRELGLPDNGSYTRYAELGRPYAVWNVFAAPEFSLELRQWCFPVAGCVGYRGYFEHEGAQREAETLRAQGLEAFVAGIPAYSTLGWFDDPVLSSFVHLPDAELARLIFHELAHQVAYAKGDTTFNESFATAVEQAGMRRWLDFRGDPALERAYAEHASRRRAFIALLLEHRGLLEAAYRDAGRPEDLRERKAAVFAALERRYAALKAAWGGYAGFDRWFAEGPTNAHLASVSAYHALVPAFERRLAAHDGDLRRFFDDVRRLAAMPTQLRMRELGEPVADLARSGSRAP